MIPQLYDDDDDEEEEEEEEEDEDEEKYPAAPTFDDLSPKSKTPYFDSIRSWSSLLCNKALGIKIWAKKKSGNKVTVGVPYSRPPP